MYGAIFSGIDVRDYKMVCAATAHDFPDEFELPHGRIKDQGDVGSCVSHALSSIIEYYNKKQTGDDDEMSICYIYGNRRNSEHDGPGMIMRDALDTVKHYGDVPKKYFPYNIETPDAIKLYESVADKLYDVGRPNRISEYCRVDTVAAAKTALMAGTPLLMAMEWYEDMEVIDGVLHTNYSGYGGGHCMFIYGWDKRGWKIQNSWSEDWGDHGTFVLPYELGVEECWAVMDDIIEDVVIKKPFSSKTGKFVAKIINRICNVFHKPRK